MKTTDYLRILSRSWLIILIMVIAGGLGGFWIYHGSPSMYTSSVHLYVAGSGSQPDEEIASRLLSSERAVALSQVARTAPAVQAAKKAAHYPHAAVTATATAAGNSPFFTITVKGRSAAQATAIANEFARTLPATMVSLEGPADRGIHVSNLAPASYSGKAVSPDLRRDIGLSLIVGLLLGVVIAVIRETFDRTVRDSTDLADVTDLTILGTIPRDEPKNQMPAMSAPRSARAEGYRQVRTTLLNVRNPKLRTIAVTSAALGEGKTSLTTNVATAFSRAGHRVAVVDGDLRRPAVSTFFGVGTGRGLSEVLAGICSLDEALNVLDNGRLAILTSGARPANPSEALAGAAMKRVLADLADRYDYVFVDTPPVLPVSDPLVMATLVDAVVLVIQLGRTTRERLQRATSALARVNATVLGVVPNMSGKGRDRDYRYPYHYAYLSGRKEETVSLPIPVGNGQASSEVHG